MGRLKGVVRRATSRRIVSARATNPMVPPASIEKGMVFNRWPNLIVETGSPMARFLMGSGERFLTTASQTAPKAGRRRVKPWPNGNRRGMTAKRRAT